MKKKYIYMDEIGHLPTNGWSVKKKKKKLFENELTILHLKLKWFTSLSF